MKNMIIRTTKKQKDFWYNIDFQKRWQKSVWMFSVTVSGDDREQSFHQMHVRVIFSNINMCQPADNQILQTCCLPLKDHTRQLMKTLYHKDLFAMRIFTGILFVLHFYNHPSKNVSLYRFVFVEWWLKNAVIWLEQNLKLNRTSNKTAIGSSKTEGNFRWTNVGNSRHRENIYFLICRDINIVCE